MDGWRSKYNMYVCIHSWGCVVYTLICSQTGIEVMSFPPLLFEPDKLLLPPPPHLFQKQGFNFPFIILFFFLKKKCICTIEYVAAARASEEMGGEGGGKQERLIVSKVDLPSFLV